MTDYRPALRSFINETFILAPDAPPFGDGESLMESHIVDSTGFLDVILFVEETWGITVEDEEVLPENFDSLDGLQGYLMTKLNP